MLNVYTDQPKLKFQIGSLERYLIASILALAILVFNKA